ncbi:MAG: sugar ABC transporter permease [Dorea sp.]|jgi:multiple sugar transport system permease protein|nr:sugar ABC transporter permease [Lachnospiraceae bacterium]MCI9229041.1 sugar ABC transporter permease [Dorea sp.]MCI9619870.1 sugar ABC transporter permease [Dorea sp.]
MKRMKVRNKKENLAGLLFIMPALIPMAVFWIGPVLYSVGMSFTDWDMISDHFNFVGFYNYISLIGQHDFTEVLWNTLAFALGTVVPSIVLGLLAALALNLAKRSSGFYRAVIFAPYITPMVAVSIVWSWIFEPRVGILNYLLGFLGIHGIEWTQSMDTAMLSVIIVTVWKQIGWTMLFYLGALQKVSANLLEAAAIDGADSVRRFFSITLPMISPTTFFLLIITTINSLQAYDQIQVLTQGGPAGSTRTLLYYFYQEAFESFNTGKASSVAVILVILTALLSLIEKRASKNSVYYG